MGRLRTPDLGQHRQEVAGGAGGDARSFENQSNRPEDRRTDLSQGIDQVPTKLGIRRAHQCLDEWGNPRLPQGGQDFHHLLAQSRGSRSEALEQGVEDWQWIRSLA